MNTGATLNVLYEEQGTDATGIESENKRPEDLEIGYLATGSAPTSFFCRRRSIQLRMPETFLHVSGIRLFPTFQTCLEQTFSLFCVEDDIHSTASKHTPEIPLEDLLPKSPPVIIGEGAEKFLEHLKHYEYPKKIKDFYHKPIRFDTSELEEGK